MSNLTTNAGRASAKRRAVKRAGGGNGSANLKTTRLDPTRTVMMRKALTVEMRRRFARLKAAVVKLVVDEDAFGADRVRTFNSFCPTGEGGGIDPSCSPSKGSEEDQINKEVLDAESVAPKAKLEVKRDRQGLMEEFYKGEVSGLRVKTKIPNVDSISGTFDEDTSTELGGIREVSIDLFDPQPYASADDERKVDRIAAQIKENGWISPLIVVTDSESRKGKGWWSLEGSHRLQALKKLGIKTFPAVVIVDHTESQPTTNAGRWYGQPDRDKVRLFAEWLKRQMGKVVAGKTARELFKRYAAEGMKKGAGRAFDDVHKREKFLGMEDKTKLDFYSGSKDQFLRESFRQPVAVQRVEALAGRSYDDLENITTDMSARMGRTLLDGLVQGKGAKDLAVDLADEVDIGRTRAEVIARNEIIRAHAEGQLQAMDEMGIEEVGVAVEWSTADDERVCPKCEALEGIVLKVSEARGMIPRHPNCRCSFLPAGLGEDDSDQIDTKRGINKALKDAGEDDDWGPNVVISRDRPEGIFNEEYLLFNWCNQYGGDTCKDGAKETPLEKFEKA